MVKKMFFACFFVFALFLFVSCGNKTSNDKRGIITVNVGPEPKTIDPGINSASDGSIYIIHAFEGLVTKDKDNNIVPGVAEKWDVSDDGMKYTFYLRSNAKWSDGKPVTAEDFVYAWQRVVNPAIASPYSFQHEPVKNAKAITAGKMPINNLGVKAIDNNTLEVTLEAPTPYFMDLAAFPTYYPVRKDVVEQYGDTWTQKPETYIGNGPFTLVERRQDDRLIMNKNTNYWNKDAIVPEEINFILMNNETASVAGIKEGSLLLSRYLPTQDIPKFQKEGIMQIKPILATYYYCVNYTNKYLKDPKVRKALSLAIDRNYIVEQVMKGGQRPADAWVPYGISDYEGGFRENGGGYYNVKKEDYAANIEEAKKLMAEAGYTNGEGFPVLEFKTDSGQHVATFEAVQQMWKENLGIDTTITQEEWSVFQQTRNDKNLALARGGWYGDFNDPINFLSLFVSYSPKNYGAYSNVEYDKLIELSSTTGDQKKRMEYLHKAEDMIMNESALIPLYFYTEPLIVSPKLHDVAYDPLGMHRFFYAYVE